MTMTKRIQRALSDALSRCRTVEGETGQAYYVVVCHDMTLELTDRMPILGQWFTSDGVRHG